MTNEIDIKKERLIDYALYVLFLSIIFVILFFCCKLSGYSSIEEIHLNGFRNMLGILVTSEAAIFALVVSVSLITIQLAASSYSVRIIDLFLEDSYFKNTIFIFILLILYELFLLVGIQYKLLEQYIDLLLASTYISAIILFYFLVLYIENTMNLLKPNMLLDTLERKTVLWTISKDDQPGDENDLLLPITDMIIGSLKRYDESTFRYGIEKLKRILINLINNNKTNINRHRMRYFIAYHLNHLIRLAIERRDEYATNSLFLNAGRIGEAAIETDDLEEITLEILDLFKKFGKVSAKQKLSLVISETPSIIEDIGLCAMKNKSIESSRNRVRNLKKIMYNSSYLLKKIAIEAIEIDVYAGAYYSAESLNRIGDSAISHSFETETLEAAGNLADIGERLIQHYSQNSGRFQSIRDINHIEEKATIESIIYNIAKNLGRIGTSSAERNWEGAAKITAIGLTSIGREAIDHDLERYVIDTLLESLENIREEASKQGLREALQVCSMKIDFLNDRIESISKRSM